MKLTKTESSKASFSALIILEFGFGGGGNGFFACSFIFRFSYDNGL